MVSTTYRRVLALAVSSLLVVHSAAAMFPAWVYNPFLLRGVPIGGRTQVKAKTHQECDTVMDFLESNSELSILHDAVHAAGFDETLEDENVVLTLFAPNNDAFRELLERLSLTEEQLLDAKILLTRVLSYHISPGHAVMEDDMDDGKQLSTLARMPPIIGIRQKLEVKRGADGSIILDGLGSDARILESDKVACRSVVHIIDTVLLPDKLPKLAAA